MRAGGHNQTDGTPAGRERYIPPKLGNQHGIDIWTVGAVSKTALGGAWRSVGRRASVEPSRIGAGQRSRGTLVGQRHGAVAHTHARKTGAAAVVTCLHACSRCTRRCTSQRRCVRDSRGCWGCRHPSIFDGGSAGAGHWAVAGLGAVAVAAAGADRALGGMQATAHHAHSGHGL